MSSLPVTCRSPSRAWHSGEEGEFVTRIPSHSIEDAPQAAEAFVYLGLTVFTSYFLNYAGTELDIPAGAPGSGPADAGPPATTSGAGS
jgi:hypothetical protein